MKKVLMLVVAAMASFALFAQNAKSTGLTDKDVKNFVKNYTAISTGLEKIGGYENKETGTIKEFAEAEILLEKNGITGPNRCEKVGMIGKSIALCIAEQEMGGIDDASLAMMKKLGMDPLARIRNTVNEADYKIVKNHYKEIAKVIDAEEAADEREPEPEPEFNPADYLKMLQGGKPSSSNDYQKKQHDQHVKNVSAIKDYEKKFMAGKKDIGMISKKYDSKNASKYKLKYSSKKLMDANWKFVKTLDIDGDYYRSVKFEFDDRSSIINYYEPEQVSAMYRTGNEPDYEVKRGPIEVTDWEDYECEANGAHEIVFHTKSAGTIHLWLDGEYEGKAVLENDAFKLEGVGVQAVQ